MTSPLNYYKTPFEGEKPKEEYPTIHDDFKRIVAEYPETRGLCWKVGDTWKHLTYSQYYEASRLTARAFIALGLEQGRSVNILGFNSKEWFLANMGAIFAGGVSTGVYTSNTPDQCEYVAEHSECQIVVVEDDKQLRKYLEVKHRLPGIKAIVVIDNTIKTNVTEALAAAAAGEKLPAPGEKDTSEGKDSEGNKLVYTWDAMVALASNVEEAVLTEKISAQKPTDVSTLIYTSGTTGNPKGVMLTHYNIVFTVASLIHSGIIRIGEEHFVTYLPLSHIAEQIVTLYGALGVAGTVWFADPGALRGTLVNTLKEVRPTVFLGVPRVWEKIQAKIQETTASVTGFKKTIGLWARQKGLEGGYNSQRGEPKPWGWWLADTLVFSKVLSNLGLDRCRVMVTSAAPIALDTLEFFLSYGIPIYEVFGMSELTGPGTLTTVDKFKTGTAGPPIPGVEVKIAEDGELCVRGLNVTKGYFKNESATAETIDEEGWLHTGDIGIIEEGGFVRITDRKKELIITAGGENIPPALLEGLFRSIPVVNQAVVIGDAQKYLTLLVTLDADRLGREAEACGAECGKDTEKAATDEKFNEHLWTQIQEVNKKLAQVQTIKKFVIIPKELSPEGGELTPTMKLKRRIINDKFKDLIGLMYDESITSPYPFCTKQ